LAAARGAGGAGAPRGPFLLECTTHRRRGHYEGDQQAYRDEEAEREWARRDPIPRFEDHAIERGWLDRQRAESLARDAAAEVERAVEYGRAGAPLTAEQAAELVYAP
ncbi:MAG: thiamine pyrophosphate-dependent enzyme, partial [Solirubrobacteraceae bacterium]